MPKARVLAVDDQRYFRELIEGMLTEEGFEAQTASSGEEALHILDQSHFDVVITDLVMPGMDGCELVHRVKERDPDQDVVVVTGVVDVKTAVEAMKLGATDYLLKPFDRTTLSGSLENILQQRRLKSEHARLLAENIEYMGERSLFERALKLFARLSVPGLAEEIIEALCVEIEAQRGVLWVQTADASALELSAARGLVRLEEEPKRLDAAELPAALQQGPARTLRAEEDGGAGDELHVALRQDGRVIALARVGDKLGGGSFDPVDLSCAERLASFAETALANAMRFRALERRTLQDPASGAYIYPYFEDVTRNEVEKANRFGRSFSLLGLDLGPVDRLREQRGEERVDAWLAAVAERVRELLRATDLLAVDAGRRFFALLPEADALGASQLKERARETLAAGELWTWIDPELGLEPEVSIATFPADGTQLEALVGTLEARIEGARAGRARIRELEQQPFGDSLRTLLEKGHAAEPDTAGQIVRFVFEEVARRPAERRLLLVAPGRALAPAVAEGLEGLRGIPSAAEIAVVAGGDRPAYAHADVAWVAPRPSLGGLPFLIHYGDGPPYALVREEGQAGSVRMFHTSDRGLVEHLALRLGRELAVRSTASWSRAEDVS
jgi:diguanylate cyclase (GGDEF)-like protein